MPQTKSSLKGLVRTGFDLSHRRGCLRLDMNENASGLPGSFVKKLANRLDGEFLAAYPDYAIFEKQLARYLKLHPENICLANGSDSAIKYLFDAYIKPGDRILMTNPTFAMYPIYARISGAVAESLDYHDDLSFPYGEFMDRLSSRVSMAVLVNPNNPTGTALPRKRVLELIRKAASRDVLLAVDEAYFYFYSESVIDAIRKYDNLVVFRTFSKLCALANLRLGFAAACPEIISALKKVKPTFDVNGISILFASAVLGEKGLIQRLIREAMGGKKYLEAQLGKAKISYVSGNANFVLIDCGSRVNEIIKKLAAEKILVSGGFKQPFLSRFLRVTVGHTDTMRKFWKEFSRIYAEGQKPSRPGRDAS